MSASTLEPRLTRLEEKASYAEDLLDDLNRLVYQQQQQLDQLTREVVELRQQLAHHNSGGGTTRNLRDELPPHY
ncbi:MAG: SlyX family protein [Macromonas sp.]